MDKYTPEQVDALATAANMMNFDTAPADCLASETTLGKICLALRAYAERLRQDEKDGPELARVTAERDQLKRRIVEAPQACITKLELASPGYPPEWRAFAEALSETFTVALVKLDDSERK